MAPKVSIGQRWQIIGMHMTGMSCRATGRELNLSHTTISRLIAKHGATGEVKDRSRTERPRKIDAREDREMVRMARRNPFLNSVQLLNLWRTCQRLSTGTVRKRLYAAGLRARRPVRRPILAPRRKLDRLNWFTTRQGWNIRSWRSIHWSDESRFPLHVQTAERESGGQEEQHITRETSRRRNWPQALVEEWNRIPLRRIRRLIESMRRRVRVTIAA
ncbi:uncharacterized protein [Haliotis asinina]|uniref:uncharacterized protein n=1 Tax=Haliotis asinina TaxID=109174 RepID=UPI003531BDFE